MRLKEKVAIVTGSGRGIGRTIARQFVEEGASVVIAEQDEQSGRRVHDELQGPAALLSLSGQMYPAVPT